MTRRWRSAPGTHWCPSAKPTVWVVVALPKRPQDRSIKCVFFQNATSWRAVGAIKPYGCAYAVQPYSKFALWGNAPHLQGKTANIAQSSALCADDCYQTSLLQPNKGIKRKLHMEQLVHLQGFEPGTHWLRVSCSTNWAKGACTCSIWSFLLAPPAGLEPATSWLTVMRSTDWAKEEYKLLMNTNIH